MLSRMCGVFSWRISLTLCSSAPTGTRRHLSWLLVNLKVRRLLAASIPSVAVESMNATCLWVKSNLSLCGGSVHCSRWNGQLSVEMCAVSSWTHPSCETTPSPMSAIPSHHGNNAMVRRQDGMGWVGGWWKLTFTEQLLCNHIGGCLHQLIYSWRALRSKEELKLSQMVPLQLDQDQNLT